MLKGSEMSNKRSSADCHKNNNCLSPNVNIMPVTAEIVQDHLFIGGCDTVDLAKQFGTPLWLMDEETIVQSIRDCQAGLADYPRAKIFYAGKAFLCLAMCHLLKYVKVGLDVVSEGELFTALEAGMPHEDIMLHGNNKSVKEIEIAIDRHLRIVVDNQQELKMIAEMAAKKNLQARILLRVVPGITGKTHKHIQTGQEQSKFGIALGQLSEVLKFISEQKSILFLGLHAHIGSHIHDLEPFKQTAEILAKSYESIKGEFGIEPTELNLGGGLGIAYTESDAPLAISTWSCSVAASVSAEFSKRHLSLPTLLLEPGRAIVGTAGITLYRVGFDKWTTEGTHYVAVDGGMADNPRPITYQAKYTAKLANRMGAQKTDQAVTIVGKYCEQGDIIIKDSLIAPENGDLIAVFDTGAYNSSMASNYNRTGRPACVLVAQGKAEIIIERENNADLISKDRIPPRLLKDPGY